VARNGLKSVPICPANVPNCPQTNGTPLKKYQGKPKHSLSKNQYELIQALSDFK